MRGGVQKSQVATKELNPIILLTNISYKLKQIGQNLITSR